MYDRITYMRYKQHLNNKEIYEIENFITDKQINQLLCFVNLNDNDEWFYHNPGSVMAIIQDDKKKNFNKILKKIEKSIYPYFINANKYVGLHWVKRLKSGESMGMHTDLGPNNNNNEMVFGIVIYLNDNFEGGELYYNELDYKIKPKKGSLLVHKSTYAHEVLTITKGERYFITCFVWGNEETKFIFK